MQYEYAIRIYMLYSKEYLRKVRIADFHQAFFQKMVQKICRLCFECKPRTIGIFTGKGIKLKITWIIRLHFPDEVMQKEKNNRLNEEQLL